MSDTQATANLSIGIKTDKAKGDLAALKKWLASEMKGIAIDIDPKALEQSIKTSLGNRRFKVTIDTKDLANEVANDVSSKLQKTLNEVFSTKRDVGYNHDKLVGGIKAAIDGNFGRRDRALEFDRNRLTTDIDSILARTLGRKNQVGIDTERLREQIAGALAGVSLHLGTSGLPAPSASLDGAALARQIAPELGNVIHAALTPAVDELVKAASVMAGIARSGGGQRVTKGDPTAAISQSATLVDGTRVRVSMPIDAATGAHAIDDANRTSQGNKTEDAARREALRRERELELKDRREAAEKAAEMDRMWGQRDAAEAATRERGVTAMLKAEIASRTAAHREGLESFRNFAAAEKKIQDEINAALADGEKTRRANLALGKMSASEAARTEAERSARNVAITQGAGINTGTQYNVGNADSYVRFWMGANLDSYDKAEREVEAWLKAETAKVEAALRQKNEALSLAWGLAPAAGGAHAGEQWWGAQIVSGKVDALNAPAPTSAASPSSVFGPSRNDIQSLKDYERAQTAVAKAQLEAISTGKRFNGVLGEMHDGARGLAGSLGALWLTWGSVAPLAAGAAIGAAFREVITSGKDVEYQLQFVSELTDNAALSMKDLAAATKGSMVGPVEAGQALRGLAQNGLSATEALSALPTILNLATAGEMGLTEASLGATGVMAAFNLSIEDLGHISDVFAKAAAMSNTSVSGMVEAMKQASQVGDEYHVTLEETAASLAVLAKRNIEGTAAGTAFRNMIGELATPSKKAQAALKEMGVELYDSSHQLKSFPDLLAALGNATSHLNEQGKLTFLKDVFDERGAKAVNALLSDSDLLAETLQKLKTGADGFTSSLVAGLQQTAQGKLKQLSADFQSAGAAAFEATPSIKNLLDELRGVAGSEEMASGLHMITDGFVGTARVLVEHPVLIGGVAAAWKGLSMFLKGEAATALKVAEAATGAEAVALAGVAEGAAGMAAAFGGPIALIAAMGAAFLLLAHHTTEAEESYENYANALKENLKSLDAESDRLRDQVELLQRKNELMMQGETPQEAQRLAEGTLPNADEKKHQDIRAALLKQRDEATEAINSLLSGTSGEDASGAMSVYAAQIDHANAGLKEQDEILAKLAAKRRAVADQRSAEKDAAERDRLLSWLAEYNAAAAKLEALTGKDHVSLRQVDPASLSGQTNAQIKDLEDQLQREKNSKLGSYTTPKTDHDADALQRQKTRGVIDELNSEESKIKEAIKANRELNDARYDAASYGPYLKAVLSESSAISDQATLLDFERRAVAALQAEKAKQKKGAEVQALDNEIAKRQANIALLVQEQEVRAQVDRLKAEAANRAEDRANAKYDAEQLAAGNQRIAAIDQKYHAKLIDPVEAARASAELAVSQAYAKGIADQQERVTEAMQAQQELALLAATADDNEKAAADEALAAADARLQKEQAILKARQEAARLQAKKESDHAATGENYAESWQGGMETFWTKFQNSAENTGKVVSDAMDSAYKTMEQGLDNFVTTGKMNFKSFTASILSDVARMMANQALRQLLVMGVNWAMSAMGGYTAGGSAASNAPDNIDAGGGWSPATASANGNIMTADGPLTLRKYANGGIARTPQLSVFGEGRLPEAYVPLPDGRSIPVTMQGSGGDGGGTAVNITINVQSNGKAQIESDTSGGQAGKLATMMEDAVMTIINREKRSGGLLATTS
jgi:TP901 family phage tail tape measure protein/lambda family phage tail tape measure protein